MHIDRPAVARGDQQQADIGDAAQGLPGRHRHLLTIVAHLPGDEAAIGVAHLADQLLQGHAEQREFLRVRLHPDLLGTGAGDIAGADIRHLGQFRLHLHRQPVQILVVPARGGSGRRRQGRHNGGHIVDAAPDDQRRVDAGRDAVHVGADLLVHAHHGGVLIRADVEARGHHHLIVPGLAVDVIHVPDRLDDRLQRLGHQLHRVGRLQAVGGNNYVDHRNADLRFLLARYHGERDHPGGNRRQQEQRRQRRADTAMREPAGNAALHGPVPVSGSASTSPSCRPERISMPSSGIAGIGRSRPRCTGTSTVSASPCTST